MRLKVVSYVLAKQTQQPKTIKTLHLYTGQYSNFCLYKNKSLRVASRPLRLSEKDCQFLLKTVPNERLVLKFPTVFSRHPINAILESFDGSQTHLFVRYVHMRILTILSILR